MFYFRYLGAELRRRKGRTVLTATCLALGVGLVVAVTALSAGLDEAQSEVLEPLTGVGTEMSVSRPMEIEQGGAPPDAGGGPIGLDDLGRAGEKFDTYRYVSTDTSFPAAKRKRVAAVDGVDATAVGLTLSVAHVSGVVPEQSASASSPAAGAPPTGSSASGGPPDSINFDTTIVSGVDTSNPDLGLLTASQITDGSYIAGTGDAVVSQSYATQEDLAVGDTVEVGGKDFDVVGISSGAVGGQPSDVYVELGRLQKLADLEGRVNSVEVRASSAGEVGAVSGRIESAFPGSEVTTSSDLADQVSGSLVDAKNLSGKLGTALAVVALIGAFGITTLVTLSSVAKRTRELGTLKAIGWRQWLVVRQVAGESVLQGLIGGLLGVAVGLAAAAAIGAAGISLDASLAPASGMPSPPGGGAPPGIGGPPGADAAASVASTVTLGAPVSPGVALTAICLAVAGGLIAGVFGGMRAARLRPAEALRSLG
ncbi:MAG: ABC transporter permease [Solirubrobacterales bacterium]|nr:ABC transporter permease [Solirubrobacterales bacterium]